MNPSNKGRPQSITDDELRKVLLEYASKSPGKISYLGLEKETGIKRHIWARRMKDEIRAINNKTLNIDASKFIQIPLPNVIDMIEKYFGNKDKLIEAFLVYNDYIQALWEKALKYEKGKETEIELRQKIKELESEVKFLKGNRKYYKEQYEKICVESTYASKQKEKNIKDVLKIDDGKKITSSNWKKQFSELFE